MNEFFRTHSTPSQEDTQPHSEGFGNLPELERIFNLFPGKTPDSWAANTDSSDIEKLEIVVSLVEQLGLQGQIPVGFLEYINIVGHNFNYQDALKNLFFLDPSQYKDAIRSQVELPEERKDPRVKPTIEEYSRALSHALIECDLNGKISPIIYGSFLIGDPSENPDLDTLLIMSSKETLDKEDRSYLCDQLEENPALPEEVEVVYFFCESTLDSLRAIASSWHISSDKEAIAVDVAIGALGKILVGEPVVLSPERVNFSSEEIDTVRRNIIELCQENVSIRLLVCAELSSIVSDRKLKVRPVYR